jgi:hypothetical protein
VVGVAFELNLPDSGASTDGTREGASTWLAVGEAQCHAGTTTIDAMRRQYYFRPTDDGYDAWDVEHLIEQSKDLPRIEVPLDSIAELDTVYWFGADGSPMTVRILVRHLQLVNDVDPAYPVILAADGQLMDGMHRVARALLEGRPTVTAVRFAQQPKPDHRDVRPEELPW